MNYVFFCGKSSLEHWKKELNLLKYKVELYPLPVDDMKNSDEYNDFMKRKDLWIYLKEYTGAISLPDISVDLALMHHKKTLL